MDDETVRENLEDPLLEDTLGDIFTSDRDSGESVSNRDEFIAQYDGLARLLTDAGRSVLNADPSVVLDLTLFADGGERQDEIVLGGPMISPPIEFIIDVPRDENPGSEVLIRPEIEIVAGEMRRSLAERDWANVVHVGIYY